MCTAFMFFFFLMIPPPPESSLFPYTTLFRSGSRRVHAHRAELVDELLDFPGIDGASFLRSEEHTSELQPHSDLVSRLLLEKKKKIPNRLLPPNYTLKYTNPDSACRSL